LDINVNFLKKILKFAHENGCPWDESATIYHAARRGHFEIVKWLHENGCPGNEYTCSSAAEGGHLEILIWLRSNGCPWDEWVFKHAIKRGHVEVILLNQTLTFKDTQMG
jgi:hypothetical protein